MRAIDFLKYFPLLSCSLRGRGLETAKTIGGSDVLIQLFLAQSLEASFISDALLRALIFSAATVEKSRLARGEVWRVCARICARTRRILLTLRDRADFVRKTLFSIGKTRSL